MARKQSPKQQQIVGRVMHEFKHGQLASSSGRKVKSPRQAIAIALHEAGASRDETPAGNRRNLARTKAMERQAGMATNRANKKASARSPMKRGGEQTRAALYGEATARGIAGRSRMTKAQLARALGR
jgi:ribosomal protein S12 methylthiotransferase accessory factor YcaO